MSAQQLSVTRYLVFNQGLLRLNLRFQDLCNKGSHATGLRYLCLRLTGLRHTGLRKSGLRDLGLSVSGLR